MRRRKSNRGLGGGFVGYETDLRGDELKEYAIKRWGSLSWRGKQDRDITWTEFAERIRATGDPGSEKVADELSRMPGMVRGFPLPMNPHQNPETAAAKRRCMRG